MKSIYGVTLCLFLFSACKEAVEKPLEATAFFKATLDNLEWIATPEINWGSIDDTVTIIGMGNEEHIYFRIKLVDEGVYELNGEQALYFTTLGLDAVTSEYILKSNQQSSVTITDYDKNRQIISGRFNIYLQKEWPNTADTLEVLNFTNGEFKGEITYFE
jgi:hypothetical protein